MKRFPRCTSLKSTITIQAKYLNSINVLKYLSHPHTGCNRKLLLQLYKSLVRSQLDYGSPIFSHSAKSSLKLLDTIQTSALKLALGVLRSSPALSLCAESHEPPLQYRYSALTANFLASTDQFPQLPIFSPALDPQNSLLLHLQSHVHKPLGLSPLQPILPSTPPWRSPPPNIRLELANIPKTSNSVYRQHINNTISSKFPTHILCFTDGSKSRTKAGYAYSIQGTITAHRLRNSASIFTAELQAIYSCLSYLTLLTPHSKFFLLNDSLSSLKAMQDSYSSNPIVQRIHILLHTLSSSSITVSFRWIPGHINHTDHDMVDTATKESLQLLKISDSSAPPAYDLKIYYCSLI